MNLGDEVEKFGISGKSFAVAGNLKSMTRDELKKYISACGGKLVGSISNKTDYLISMINLKQQKMYPMPEV